MKKIKLGLSGNPNAGKTSIFNALTGSHQKVGNYAGVTVEKKAGKKIYRDYEFTIYDLPGTYSLTAYSLDEVIARDFIIEEQPDVIIDVIDATNVERNLYLCLQFQELKIPVVGALNIVDQAEEMGIRIDDKQLSKLLGIPMIKTIGPKGLGMTELLDEVIKIINDKNTSHKIPSYGAEVETEIQSLVKALEQDAAFCSVYPARWLAIKLLEKDKNAWQKIEQNKHVQAIQKTAQACIRKIESHFGRDAEIIISEQRYAYIHGTIREVITKVGSRTTLTERLDNILLNRFLALPIFLFILWVIFQTTFALGAYPQGWLESFFGWIGSQAATLLPAGLLKSLIIDGIIGGFGNVFSFIPLIIILFMFISILEDSGYMARAAFTMDKFLHIFGLHGQSFLPLILGFGCSVPAMLASRTLKSPKDRITTVLVTPFMNCGAKLPVHVLLAGAFFTTQAGNVVLSIYISGILLALVSAALIRRTVLKGETTPFVMELPPYRLPTLKGILWHIWDKARHYVKKAGTVILAASIIIWAITSFPRPDENSPKYQALVNDYKAKTSAALQTTIAAYVKDPDKIKELASAQEQAEYESLVKKILQNETTIAAEVNRSVAAKAQEYNARLLAAETLTGSLAGRIGKFIEPVIQPLGFDWKIGIATMTGFAAKEIVVSTLGTLYSAGSGQDEKSDSLRQALQKDKVFNPLVAYVLMLFLLILAPCFAAQATIKAELGWKWLGFYYIYTTVFAWGLCFAVYRLGILLGLGG